MIVSMSCGPSVALRALPGDWLGFQLAWHALSPVSRLAKPLTNRVGADLSMRADGRPGGIGPSACAACVRAYGMRHAVRCAAGWLASHIAPSVGRSIVRRADHAVGRWVGRSEVRDLDGTPIARRALPGRSAPKQLLRHALKQALLQRTAGAARESTAGIGDCLQLHARTAHTAQRSTERNCIHAQSCGQRSTERNCMHARSCGQRRTQQCACAPVCERVSAASSRGADRMHERPCDGALAAVAHAQRKLRGAEHCRTRPGCRGGELRRRSGLRASGQCDMSGLA